MADFKSSEKFGVTPNNILNSEELSWKAKGLYGYLNSKPDGWNFSVAGISSQGKDGRDGVIAGIQELEDGGYLQRNKFKNELGQWDIQYILTSTPITEIPERSITAFPYTEIPETISNTEVSKTDSIILDSLIAVNNKVPIILDNNNTILDQEDLFEKFWNLYPKQLGRKLAKEKFKVKAKQDGGEFIINRLEVFVKNWDPKKTAITFIPHPSTWLNQERYHDEIIEATPTEDEKYNYQTSNHSSEKNDIIAKYNPEFFALRAKGKSQDSRTPEENARCVQIIKEFEEKYDLIKHIVDFGI